MRLRMPDLKDPDTRMRVLMYLGAALIVVLVILPGAIQMTSNPTGFCLAVCHQSMKPYISEWQKSSHSAVTCYACHGHEPGVIPLMMAKMVAMKELYLQLADSYEKPINGESKLAEELSSEPCELCHSIENRKVTPSNGIIINHKVHLDNDISCTHCHNRVAHGQPKDYPGEPPKKSGEEEELLAMEGPMQKREFYQDWMSMRHCMTCHTGEEGKGPKECSACHTKGFELKPGNHMEASWLRPKAPDKKAIHPKLADVDMDYCKLCHEVKSFCRDCHGVSMPHAPDFKKKHGPLGRSRPQVCRLCHRAKNFCNDCHHEGARSGVPWVKQHSVMVKKTGAEKCFDCHKEIYCSHCHVTGKKYRSIKGPNGQ